MQCYVYIHSLIYRKHQIAYFIDRWLIAKDIGRGCHENGKNSLQSHILKDAGCSLDAFMSYIGHYILYRDMAEIGNLCKKQSVDRYIVSDF